MLETLREEFDSAGDGGGGNAAVVRIREVRDREGWNAEAVKVLQFGRGRVGDVRKFKADRAFQESVGVAERRERGEEVNGGGGGSHGGGGNGQGRRNNGV